MLTRNIGTSNPKKIVDLESRRAAERPANVTPFPNTGDVIAVIQIELRRGGKLSHRTQGITASNAHRFTSILIRLLAETFQTIKPGR